MGPRTLSPQHIIAFFGDTNYINNAQIRYVCHRSQEVDIYSEEVDIARAARMLP